MAKRFTDTMIWQKAWFRKLEPRLKEAWRYMVETCDHAGIWDIDLDLMAFNIGEPVSMDEIEHHFGDKLVFHKKDKLFIPSFIEFQYGDISDESKNSNVKKSIIQILKKEGVWEGFTNPSGRDQVKVKVKVKEKVQVSDPEKSEIKPDGFEEILSLFRETFPQATKGPKAEKRYQEQIKTEADRSDLLRSIPSYAKHLKEVSQKQGFKKAPKQTFQTFLGTESSGYFWRDHIPSTDSKPSSAYKDW